MLRSLALFVAWSVTGFIGSWLLLYGFTPAGPVILIATWLADRLLPRIGGERLPEAYGALGGFGVFCFALARSLDGDATGFWLFGTAVIALSVALYATGGRRRCAKSAVPA
jgi:hypothetical protein